MRLRGKTAVPQNPRDAFSHLVHGLLSGAIGLGLQITHRSERNLRFRAVSLGALCAGMSSGELEVIEEGGNTKVRFQASILTSVVFGVVPGICVGLGSSLLPILTDSQWRWPMSLGWGVMAVLAWAGFVLRRNRLRIENFLYNLRYVN